ncbi:10643_t:CDS:2, partial [Gigaspora margarita]
MTALPLIAAAVSSIIDYPVKTYDECIAEGLDPNKILDIELIHKYSITESNDNGEFVKRPMFKQYEENVKKNGYYVEDEKFDDKNTIKPSDDEKIEIFAYDHRNYALNVTTNETVLELKKKIRSMFDIDIKTIDLSLTLEDHRTLESYNIEQNDSIHVSRRDDAENVETYEYDIRNDEPAEHDFEKTDDKKTIKSADLEKTIQIPTEPIRIFAFHKNYALNVTTKDTVLELKNKIRSMIEIDIKTIGFSFSCKPLEDLEDHRTLESYNIKHNDTIHVSHRNDAENVETYGSDIGNDGPAEHDFEKIDDKKTIKSADLEKTIQIPTEPIRIFAYYHRNYALNPLENLEDHRTLESYKIEQNATLHVSHVTTKDTVLGLKKKLRSILDIDIKKISLSFSSKPLEDHRTLESYNIKQNDTIHVSRRIIGGAFDYFVLTNDYLDPIYDNDFTNQRGGWTFKRGNEPYQPPYGWKRFAINIKRYGDNKWLGTDRNSWPVSFHGTNKDAAENIAKDGFDLLKGKRFLYGKGIYSSPDFKEAERYAKRFFHQDCEYKVIIQNRVNPNDLRKANNDLYWITADDKNIRPY